MTIIKRGRHYHMKRRVPRRYAGVEPRKVVWISLHTDSRSEAEVKAAAVWQELCTVWQAREAGLTGDDRARFEAAKRIAAMRGFRFLPADRVAELPVDELLRRIEAISAPAGAPDQTEADALLGAAPAPPLTLSEALEEYWTIARDKTIGKSRDQIRRWRNPHIKAFRNLISVVGDVRIDMLSADDMLDFRAWWLDRIENEGLTANSANKDLAHIATVLRAVVAAKRLNIDPPISGYKIRDAGTRTRPAFSAEWIRDRILPGLGGLNPEARSIVLVMVNTGARPSEIANLAPHNVRLDASVPHIEIRPEGRVLKTKHSERVIPLVGVSLEAILPDGYPRYRDTPSLSATVNKYLRAHGLVPTPRHTLYSLRHGFEDRCLAAGIDERIRRDLMGHSLGGQQRYGEGASLAQMRDLLLRVAI